MHRIASVVVLLTACGAETDPPPPDPPITDQVVLLSPAEHLVRASMALRGTRPSVAELEQVIADPESLGAIVEGYVEGPEFGVVMRDLHAETLLVRVDLENRALEAQGLVADRTQAELLSSYEEPLHLIEHVIVNDRPYSEIVTADYTMSNDEAAVIWGTVRDPGPGWQVAHYVDARSVAGILSSSALMRRHISAGANYHRGRANMLSSALLCFDFLHSEVALDTSIDLADPEVVSDAVVNNPSCAACHQALDPLASFLWGIQPQARYATYPVPMYFPSQLGAWATTTERPPSYFGQPGSTLADLGQLIADDPRFARCTAMRFASYFTQTGRDDLPFPWVARLTAGFVESGLDAKSLAKEVVLSDEFRVATAADTASDEVAEEVHGMLHVRPEQLDSLLADLTGFRWQTTSTKPLFGAPYGQANLLRGDYLGFRALAGGIDSYYVTRPTHTTTAVSSLVLRTAAGSAAGVVVDRDFAVPPAERKLLALVAPDQSDEPGIRAQLAALHARIYGELVEPDSEHVTETYGVFAEVMTRTGNVTHAWKITLTAMLSDVRVTYY